MVVAVVRGVVVVVVVRGVVVVELSWTVVLVLAMVVLSTPAVVSVVRPVVSPSLGVVSVNPVDAGVEPMSFLSHEHVEAMSGELISKVLFPLDTVMLFPAAVTRDSSQSAFASRVTLNEFFFSLPFHAVPFSLSVSWYSLITLTMLVQSPAIIPTSIPITDTVQFGSRSSTCGALVVRVVVVVAVVFVVVRAAVVDLTVDGVLSVGREVEVVWGARVVGRPVVVAVVVGEVVVEVAAAVVVVAVVLTPDGLLIVVLIFSPDSFSVDVVVCVEVEEGEGETGEGLFVEVCVEVVEDDRVEEGAFFSVDAVEAGICVGEDDGRVPVEPVGERGTGFEVGSGTPAGFSVTTVGTRVFRVIGSGFSSL